MLSNHERRILNEIEADLTSVATRRSARRAGIRRGVVRVLTVAVLVAAIVLCALVSITRPLGSALIALSAMALGVVLATMLRRVVLDVQWRLRYRSRRR
jgi:hypothetical protein